jgi:hypothetical protein
MDIFAHSLYAATFFSKQGFAGGKQPPKNPFRDWTFWGALFFGALPDLLSVGLYFFILLLRGEPLSFHRFPVWASRLYFLLHSFVIAIPVLILIFIAYRKIFVISLGWPLHIFIDIFMHGKGSFGTRFFYPISDYTLHFTNWWQNLWIFVAYWVLLFIIWAILVAWRKGVFKRKLQ